jgi:hypothetical protein
VSANSAGQDCDSEHLLNIKAKKYRGMAINNDRHPYFILGIVSAC